MRKMSLPDFQMSATTGLLEKHEDTRIPLRVEAVHVGTFLDV
jgi:hypothetical protein